MEYEYTEKHDLDHGSIIGAGRDEIFRFFAAHKRTPLPWAVPPRRPGAPPHARTSSRPPVPPFTAETAALKVRAAEDSWNRRDLDAVSHAYTPDSRWRNRSEFLKGRDDIVAFLNRKWARELEYRLIKELWAFTSDRIAVRFAYEWHDARGQWYRSYGNENWRFDADGYMDERHASINDVDIAERDRLFLWPDGPRPAGHVGLSELGL